MNAKGEEIEPTPDELVCECGLPITWLINKYGKDWQKQHQGEICPAYGDVHAHQYGEWSRCIGCFGPAYFDIIAQYVEKDTLRLTLRLSNVAEYAYSCWHPDHLPLPTKQEVFDQWVEHKHLFRLIPLHHFPDERKAKQTYEQYGRKEG